MRLRDKWPCEECGHRGVPAWRAVQLWVRRYCLWNAHWVKRTYDPHVRIVNMTQIIKPMDPLSTQFRSILEDL